MADAHRRQRLELLQQLASLRCEAHDAEASTTYVDARAALLQALAEVEGPWTQEEQRSLLDVLAAGERAMQSMAALRGDLLERLRAVQQKRKFVPVIAAPFGPRARRIL